MDIVLRLQPPPSGEDNERIEDLIASTLWRHGWRGALKSGATGNTVTLKFLPQVDDGRGYPRDAGPVSVEALSHALKRVLAYLAIHDSQYYESNADALKARHASRLGRCDAAAALCAGQTEFTFAYRDGEMTATVRAALEEDARNKLDRVIHGGADADVTVSADVSQTHPDLWESVEGDMAEDEEGWNDDGEYDEEGDPIIDRSDDWPGYANAESVEI